MTVTTINLTRAAGLAAVAGGLLFTAVQINHPHLDAAFVPTTEYVVRESAKVAMAVLSLIGITGIYLRQVKQTGVLGLLGYVLFAAGYLGILCVQVIAVSVLPSLVASQPDYVNDLLTVATGGTAASDVGLFQTLNQVCGIAYLTGGFVFGIALFHAHVLPRWAAGLLAVGAASTLAIPVLPQISQRLFAIPVAVALTCLGYALWREQGRAASRPASTADNAQLQPVGGK